MTERLWNSLRYWVISSEFSSFYAQQLMCPLGVQHSTLPNNGSETKQATLYWSSYTTVSQTVMIMYQVSVLNSSSHSTHMHSTPSAGQMGSRLNSLLAFKSFPTDRITDKDTNLILCTSRTNCWDLGKYSLHICVHATERKKYKNCQR